MTKFEKPESELANGFFDPDGEVDRADYQTGRDIMAALNATNPYAALIELDKMWMSLNKHTAGVEAVQKTLAEDYDNLLKSAKGMQNLMRGIAAQLARAGSYDHRAKNEVLLGVVARLLDMSDEDLTRDNGGEIPF